MATTVLPPPANGTLAHLTHEDTPAASKPISDSDWPDYDDEDDEAESEQLDARPQRARSRSPQAPSAQITSADLVTPASAASPPHKPGPLPERDTIPTPPSDPIPNGLSDHDAEIIDSASDERADDTLMGGSGILVELADASLASSPSSGSKALESVVQPDESMAVDVPATKTPSDSTEETCLQVPPGLEADLKSAEHVETAADPDSRPASRTHDVDVVVEHDVATVEDGEGEVEGEEGGSDFEGSEESEEDPNIARIEELEDENRQLRAAMNSGRQEYNAIRTQLSNVTTQLASTEQRLLSVSADLATSRSFVSSEDADGAQLLQAFTDLLESVDDHVYLLLDEVGDPPEDATLSSVAARACADGPAVLPLREFVYTALAHGMSLQDFIPLFVQALLVVVLETHVFKPFVPGIDAQTSATLHACYADVCAAEPQDRAARWRAITYSRVGGTRNDDELATAAAMEFFGALEVALPALLPECDADTITGLRTQFASPCRKLLRDALRLRDLCMKTYLSFDYVLTFPASGSQIAAGPIKVEETLKRCLHSRSTSEELRGDGTVGVAVLAPGLTASKSKPRAGGKDGDIDRTTNVLRKPGVVVVKCQWIHAHPTL